LTDEAFDREEANMFDRRVGIVLVLVAVSSLSVREACAQRVRVGVSVGNGAVRVGIGNGPLYRPRFSGRGYGPGGWYGPGWGGPRYGYGGYLPGYGYGAGYGYGPGIGYGVVVTPAPSALEQQPVYGAPRVLPGVGSAASVVTPQGDGGEILIFSPASNTRSVRYWLNGRAYTMPPGTRQSLVNDRVWTIQFDAAPDQRVTYTLDSVRYKFRQDGAAVGLYQTQDWPTAAPSQLPPAPVPEPPLPEPPLPGLDSSAAGNPLRPAQ